MTRQQRRATLRETLERCGYSSALLSENFRVWSPELGVSPADIVAFTRADQQDMSTAAIVAEIVESIDEIHQRTLPNAVALAAPVALVALPDTLSLWAVSDDTDASHELVAAPIGDTSSIIARLGALDPESVRKIKESGAQTTLFPLDISLLSNVRNRSRRLLADIVENVVVRVSDAVDPSREVLSPRLVIGALAALMLRDKDIVSPNLQGGALIDVAAARFSGYFDWLSELSTEEQEIFDEIVRDLSYRVNFSALEPALVSDVYEQVLTTKATRREQGTFYTPPALARQILRAIPVEHLPDGERHVLDPACGSGTLLLAAAARLRELQPINLDSGSVHHYLVNHLRGYDRDHFATEITKLSLLMTALPIGNSWQVHTGDVLDKQLSNENRPSIIVSNPPWSYSRKRGRRQERADDFISWMLDNLREGGILSCVLPLSWLNSDTSKGTRELLLSRASLIEVWRLPSETFEQTSSAIAPAVIVAQKKTGAQTNRTFSLVKNVKGRHASVNRFLRGGQPDQAYLVQLGPTGEGILAGPVSRYLSKRSDLIRFDSVAIIRNGRPQKPGRPERSADETPIRELSSHRALPGFGEADPDDLLPVMFPEDFDKTSAGSIKHVLSKKVLVTAKRWISDDPWRVKVGYDLRGIAVRESFHIIVPNDAWHGWGGLSEEQRLYASMAVLGSGMCACWIDEHNPGRNIRTDVVKSLPFPNTQGAVAALARAGALMIEAARKKDLGALTAAGRHLEKTVAEVYELPEVVLQSIAENLAGHEAPEGIVRYPEKRNVDELEAFDEEDVPSYGQVLEVDEERGLRIWVSGVTPESGCWVGIPHSISGWFCQPEIDFYVSGSLEDLTSAEYRLHFFDWVSDLGQATA
ncbi:N-6 DNA methylase [Spirillospora sp. CA-142024]|uniref:HsdM family class I SAM-dependent methyltransferase n=1 Tax=Spirillospora sp. CA-142024 TaxID=3240036 RepID=UPI003D9452BB